MSYFSKKEWKFEKFEKATAKHKKYKAILRNRKTGRKHTVNYGDSRYEQFRDSTGLGLYSKKNHGDMKRKKNYRARHRKDIKDGYYSAGYFSMKYLWS